MMKFPTCVLVRSDAFNVHASRSYFINPENYGDDVVRWPMEELRRREIEVDGADPDQEDHGWYCTFTCEERLYDLVVSHVPTAEGSDWLACIERSHGIFLSMLGQRNRSIAEGVALLIHEILASSDLCGEIRWFFYEDVSRGCFTKGADNPMS
jgi:hypothetical protein